MLTRTLLLLAASLTHGLVLTPNQCPSSPLLRLRGGKAKPAPPPPSFKVKSNAAAASVGGLLGYCTGKAARSASNAAAVSVGACIALLGALNSRGYLTMNYTKMERDLMSLLDLNKDGELDREDYDFLTKKFVRLLSDNGVGSATGFTAGFWKGFSTSD